MRGDRFTPTIGARLARTPNLDKEVVLVLHNLSRRRLVASLVTAVSALLPLGIAVGLAEGKPHRKDAFPMTPYVMSSACVRAYGTAAPPRPQTVASISNWSDPHSWYCVIASKYGTHTMPLTEPQMSAFCKEALWLPLVDNGRAVLLVNNADGWWCIRQPYLK